MKKIVKIISIFLMLLLILLAIAGFYLKQVDPNKYKAKISQYVYAKTGQVLVINGDMQWSLFPWIGLKANNLTYYNLSNFNPKIFVSAKEMDIKIKLLSLIRGKMQIRNITLDNATLNLVKNSAGQYNWQNLTNTKHKPESYDPQDHSNKKITNFSIESLKIKNGKLTWYDQQQNTHSTITGLNITSKNIQFGQPFPLSLQFNLLNKDKKDLSLDLATEVILTPDRQHLALEHMKLKGTSLLNEHSIDLQAKGRLEADFEQQTMASEVSFAIENLKGHLNLKGNNISQKPHFMGILSTEAFNLKTLLEALGKPLDLQNKDALDAISLLTKIESNDSSIKLTQLHATLDKTNIFGTINLLTARKVLQLNLLANQITLDDYKSNEASSSPLKKDVNEENSLNHGSTWTINGNIKINQLNAQKLKLKNFKTTLAVQGDLIRLSPLEAQLYNGNLKGSLLINKQQKNKTAIHLKQVIKNLDVKELLSEFSDSTKLSGNADVNLDAVSVITENTNFFSGLNGSLYLSLNQGALKGIDVIYQLSRAHAFIKHLSSSGLSDSKKTDFNTLSATATIDHGILTSNDLTLVSEYLKVAGKGSTNLVNQEIKYHLNALAQPRLTAVNNKIGQEVTIYQIPIKVSGMLTKPSVNLDFIELAKIFYAKEMQKPVVKQVTKNIEHLKDDVSEKIQTNLKHFLPRKILDKLKKSNENSEATVPAESTQ